MSVSIFKHHLPCRSSRGDVCGEECANKVHPPLEKWSSEHLKNNRILSKGEEKLPGKCNRCGGHGQNRLKCMTSMPLHEK